MITNPLSRKLDKRFTISLMYAQISIFQIGLLLPTEYIKNLLATESFWVSWYVSNWFYCKAVPSSTSIMQKGVGRGRVTSFI